MSTTQNIIALESQIPTKVSDLENDAGYITGDSGTQADWNETDQTAMGYIKNKPTIPAAVTIDATLATQGAAADAKAVGDALRSGFTEWEFSGVPDGITVESINYDSLNLEWELVLSDGNMFTNGGSSDTLLVFSSILHSITATRHLITPTKTSQLTNDGAPNGGGNAYVMTNDTRLSDARTPTAHHATHSTGGSDAIAPADIGAASLADLPYRLVEPGEWEFSGDLTGFTYLSVGYNSDEGQWFLDYVQDGSPGQSDGVPGNGSELYVTFSHSGESWHITATRASLPGHLLDRAGNRVVVSGDTTLTLPAAVPGYARDFLVRLEISGSTVPTITFAAPTGETITYETDGDEFPVPDEAGDWLYSFTESCVAHKFAVALKKVNTVAQGGS